MSEDRNAGERDTPSMEAESAENTKPAKAKGAKGKGDKRPGKAPSKNSGERIAKEHAPGIVADRR